MDSSGSDRGCVRVCCDGGCDLVRVRDVRYEMNETLSNADNQFIRWFMISVARATGEELKKLIELYCDYFEIEGNDRARMYDFYGRK